jgi:hypothetical protein
LGAKIGEIDEILGAKIVQVKNNEIFILFLE